MSLALHQLWIIITTTILTGCSIVLLLFRHRIPGFFKYNESFLSLFGIESNQANWVRYLFQWAIGTCMATVVYTLIINVNENLLILTGLRGIPLDLVIIPLAITSIVFSILLISAALIPMLVVPLVPPSALGIILILQFYGIHPSFFTITSLSSTFIYFAASAIGFVGAILALYHLIRNYFGVSLLHHFRKRRKETSSVSTD
jgi:hypothetical protein